MMELNNANGYKVTSIIWFRTYFGEFTSNFAASALAMISLAAFVLSFS